MPTKAKRITPKINPKNAEVHYYLFDTYARKKDFVKAKEHSDKALEYGANKTIEDDVDGIKQQMTISEATARRVEGYRNQQYKLGYGAMNDTRYNDAIDFYSNAIILSPEWCKPYSNLGWVYQQKAKAEPENDEYLIKTKENYNKAIELCDDINAHTNLGILLQNEAAKDTTIAGKTSKYTEARSHYTIVIAANAKENKPNAQILLMNGYCCVQTDDFADAIVSLEKSAENIDQLDKTSTLNVWSLLGRAYDLEGQTEQSVECYQKVTKLDPTNFGYWYSLGFAARKINNLTLAIEAYSKSVELKPCNYDAWLGLGNAYLTVNTKESKRNATECFNEVELIKKGRKEGCP